MRSAEEIAWVAGLLEGEGSFLYSGRRGSICVTCSMTDLDVIVRLQELVPGGTVCEVKPRQPTHQVQYKWALCRRERVVPFLKMILPHMGQRRAAKIKEILEWNASRPKAVPLQSKHGTRQRYAHKGCRCDPCRAAESVYRLGLAHRRKNAQD